MWRTQQARAVSAATELTLHPDPCRGEDILRGDDFGMCRAHGQRPLAHGLNGQLLLSSCHWAVLQTHDVIVTEDTGRISPRLLPENAVRMSMNGLTTSVKCMHGSKETGAENAMAKLVELGLRGAPVRYSTR